MLNRFHIIILLFIQPITACQPQLDNVEGLEPLVSPPPVLPEEIDEVIEFVDSKQRKNGEGDESGTEDAQEDEENSGEEEGLISLSEGYPSGMEPKVQFWINFFTKRKPETIKRYLNRGEKYKAMITKILRDQGLPVDLYYLALIESGFSLRATSSAKASGTWQFMKATGKRYGLSINYYVDERWDPVRSTIAASLYLSDLNNVFQSWYLAMAAYNAGEMRIMNAIMRSNTRDFWELIKVKGLPRETLNYIPKFIAAAKIGKNPAKYGITVKESPVHEVSPTKVPTPLSLKTIAQITGVSQRTLKKLNPHLKRGITPPSSQNEYKLWVPQDSLKTFSEKKDILLSKRLNFKNRLAKNREDLPPGGYHKVRNGETLDLISRKYGLTLSQLRTISGLKGWRIFPGQKIRVSFKSSPSGKKTYQRYRVRKGDNLYSIARRFSITVKELRKMNRIRRDRIYAGQLLKVRRNQG